MTVTSLSSKQAIAAMSAIRQIRPELTVEYVTPTNSISMSLHFVADRHFGIQLKFVLRADI